MLITAIEGLEAEGVVVQFYLIQRKFNLADRLAKQGAVSADLPPSVLLHLTVLCHAEGNGCSY